MEASRLVRLQKINSAATKQPEGQRDGGPSGEVLLEAGARRQPPASLRGRPLPRLGGGQGAVGTTEPPASNWQHGSTIQALKKEGSSDPGYTLDEP